MVKLNKRVDEKSPIQKDDYEYKRITIFEMYCPVCGMRVSVDPEDHFAELHMRRFFGELVHCPGSDKIIPGDKVMTRMSVGLVKNDKGRFYNPRFEEK